MEEESGKLIFLLSFCIGIFLPLLHGGRHDSAGEKEWRLYEDPKKSFYQ